jgi:hypothetical protein
MAKAVPARVQHALATSAALQRTGAELTSRRVPNGAIAIRRCFPGNSSGHGGLMALSLRSSFEQTRRLSPCRLRRSTAVSRMRVRRTIAGQRRREETLALSCVVLRNRRHRSCVGVVYAPAFGRGLALTWCPAARGEWNQRKTPFHLELTSCISGLLVRHRLVDSVTLGRDHLCRPGYAIASLNHCC